MLVTAALIVLRSFVFLHYEQADFDADQAIVGLMATHLSEGRAWPLFFYGQLYMMGVQAWMAAVVFLFTGPTVFALKLPLLLINVVTGGLLVWLLVREAGLRAWQAVVATSWFSAVPPVAASRMVQAQGGTIEPLLYTLLLWMLRRRAVAFGLLFAFGFLHREFTLFAVVAILAIEAWTGELWSRRRAAHWCIVLLVFLGARQTVTLLRHTASMFGPAAAPPRLDDGVTNVDLVARSVCLAPGHVLGNLGWLGAHNVPTFFGVQTQAPGHLILSAAPTGVPWAAFPAGGALLLAIAAVWQRRRTLASWWPPSDRRVQLPVMLVATGLLGLGGVATGCDIRSLITLRYHLLLAFAPVGLTALAFVCREGPPSLAPRVSARSRAWARWPGGQRRPGLTSTMCAAVVIWASAMIWQHVRLLHEYRTAPPPSPYRQLADDLVAHGDRYGWASYWVSYHVDFLSREQVQLSPTSTIRIADYSRQALRAGPRAVVVGNDACSPEDRVARKVLDWWVCRRD